jgi:hypothetical protein
MPKYNSVNKNTGSFRQLTKMKQKTVFIVSATVSFLFTIFIIAILNFTGKISVFGATAGDYRSIASGNWNVPANWEKFNGVSWTPAITSPASVDGNITIQPGNNITVTANVLIDQVFVCSGAQLSTSAGICTIVNGTGTDLIVSGTLDVSSTLTINGGATALLAGTGICRSTGILNIGGGGASLTIDTNGVFKKDGGTITTAANAWVVNNGGIYRNNDGSTFPLATWNPGSTCEITTSTATVPGNINQAFQNFIWNCTTQSAPLNFGGSFINVNGNLTIASTGSSFIQLDLQGNNTTLNIANNLIVTGGKIYGCTNGGTKVNVSNNYIQSGGLFCFNMAGGTAYGNASLVMTVNGNALISGGILDMSQCSANNSTKGNGVLNLKGDMILSGTGLVTETSALSRGQVYFIGTTTQYFKSVNSVTRFIDFTVNNGAILRMDDQILTGDGNFTLLSGGGLMLGDKDGITVSGPTGNIQVTGIRSFSTGGDYTYNGIVAQNSGNGYLHRYIILLLIIRIILR